MYVYDSTTKWYLGCSMLPLSTLHAALFAMAPRFDARRCLTSAKEWIAPLSKHICHDFEIRIRLAQCKQNKTCSIDVNRMIAQPE